MTLVRSVVSDKRVRRPEIGTAAVVAATVATAGDRQTHRLERPLRLAGRGSGGEYVVADDEPGPRDDGPRAGAAGRSGSASSRPGWRPGRRRRGRPGRARRGGCAAAAGPRRRGRRPEQPGGRRGHRGRGVVAAGSGSAGTRRHRHQHHRAGRRLVEQPRDRRGQQRGERPAQREHPVLLVGEDHRAQRAVVLPRRPGRRQPGRHRVRPRRAAGRRAAARHRPRTAAGPGARSPRRRRRAAGRRHRRGRRGACPMPAAPSRLGSTRRRAAVDQPTYTRVVMRRVEADRALARDRRRASPRANPYSGSSVAGDPASALQPDRRSWPRSSGQGRRAVDRHAGDLSERRRQRDEHRHALGRASRRSPGSAGRRRRRSRSARRGSRRRPGRPWSAGSG